MTIEKTYKTYMIFLVLTIEFGIMFLYVLLIVMKHQNIYREYYYERFFLGLNLKNLFCQSFLPPKLKCYFRKQMLF